MPGIEDIDFSAIEAQALNGETDSSSGTDDAQVTQQTETEQVPQEPSIEVELPDGSKKVFTAKDIRNGVLMQSDYTKKTTEVAEMRKAAEKVFGAYQQLQTEYEQYQQERQALAEFLQDQDKVASFVAKKFGAEGVKALLTHLQQPTEQNPQGLTPQAAEQLMNRKLQGLAKEFQTSQANLQKQFQEQIALAEEAREVEMYKAQLDPIVESVLQSHPLLKADPYAAALIKFETLKQNPESVAQAKVMLEKAAKERVETLTKTFVESQKQAVLSKEKLKNGIEPPGGSGVVPQPKTYMKSGTTNKLDWRSIEADAIARLTAKR